jgi:hypothetical protein
MDRTPCPRSHAGRFYGHEVKHDSLASHRIAPAAESRAGERA